MKLGKWSAKRAKLSAVDIRNIQKIIVGKPRRKIMYVMDFDIPDDLAEKMYQDGLKYIPKEKIVAMFIELILTEAVKKGDM